MSNKKTAFYKFDSFSLDVNQQCLFYENNLVSLTPKAFQTLLVLLKNRHQIVGKEFLLNEIWADTFVEETTLSQNILTLRKTLSLFQKDKEFILTFPRRGFRFVADVEEIINTEEELFIFEKHTKTHIVAEQEIHNSTDTNQPINNTNTLNMFSNLQLFSLKNLSIVGVCLACLIIGCLSTLYLFQPNSLPQKTRSTTLLADANIKNAVISPNGKYLGLIRNKENLNSLLLRQIETSNTIEIVPKLNGELLGLAFSNDSETIFYSVVDNSNPNNLVGRLYKIPVLGGASQLIANEVDSLPAVSPDNNFVAFIRNNSVNNESLLIITDTFGKNEKFLAKKTLPESFTKYGVSWSPDGKFLATSNQINDKAQIEIINVQNGETKVFKNENWNKIGQSIWINNGKELVLPVFREISPTLSDEIWKISVADGKTNFITNGIRGDLGISFDKKNNSIVALKNEKLTCFLSAALDNFRKSNHIATRIGDACLLPIGADWNFEGQIIYSSAESGNADIWTINEDGGNKKQITSDNSAEISPIISKDGTNMFFLSNRSGKIHIWRANTDGTNQTQLTNGESVKEITLSPDGNTIFYITKNTENIWKISTNGENNTQLTKSKSQSLRISPDGKTIACYLLNEKNQMNLSLVSSENGDLIQQIELPEHDDLPFLDWSKDNENLYVVLRIGKPFSLWKVSINNQTKEKMREWENDAIFRFVISKDGERVFYEVGTEITSTLSFENI